MNADQICNTLAEMLAEAKEGADAVQAGSQACRECELVSEHLGSALEQLRYRAERRKNAGVSGEEGA